MTDAAGDDNDGDEAEPTTVDCDRCGEAVSVADASQLEKQDNKALWKILCPDCLRAIGVPDGYTLDRDLSHLES